MAPPTAGPAKDDLVTDVREKDDPAKDDPVTDVRAKGGRREWE